ncbi:MAG: uroporphyrinogen-III C-methyltransferase [Burkholderiales bacterium]|nr:uroporphyrinogen-III C-methyltransferase [Phycisphaerae bacterium]
MALVGAGPGDPGLITVRGAELLAQADVVIYDYLASPRLLTHAPQAEHVFVGKQASRHSMTQDQINALLIERARQGKRVVRLKGGDPFVFGRGGEEAEALAAAGIRFTVVPGITAAIAGAAYAGIPVTHRDFNSSFTLITGHEKEEAYKDEQSRSRPPGEGSSDLDWSVIAKLPCVAFYMGVKSLPRIAGKLIENGMSASTPAATIQWGTTTRQRTCVATLGTIADAVASAGITAPAITIVGQVVTMREKLNWFETRPLFGQTIVVTRSRDQASELARRLEELGARVMEAPTIEVVPQTNFEKVDAALHSLSLRERAGVRGLASTDATGIGGPPHPNPLPEGEGTWIVFTSANGVRAARERMRALKLDARLFSDSKVAVVGDATARAVRELLCIEPDLIPGRAVAEALADELIARNEVSGRQFILFRAEIARQVLVEKLSAADGIVQDIAVYETRPVAALAPELVDALERREVNWVTFTSSSTLTNFVALLGDSYHQKLAGVKIASIGPVTTDAIRAAGLEPTVIAETADVAVLANAIAAHGTPAS